ncbi:hypothetical protein V6N13_059086 [Hibiscus sabdariffa]
MIGSYPTIIEKRKARMVVVISSPSPMISAFWLCIAVKGFGCGFYEWCHGNFGLLSPVGGLPLVRPLLGLVKPLQTSLEEQEPIELGLALSPVAL